MGRPVVVLPDATLAVLQYLRGVAALTALVSAANIVTELPSTPVYPYLLVNQIGTAGAVYPSVEHAAMQIDALDVDHTSTSGKVTASAIARTARAAMWAIANDVTASGAVLSSCYEELGIQWFPDTVPVPHTARYMQRQVVVLHG